MLGGQTAEIPPSSRDRRCVGGMMGGQDGVQALHAAAGTGSVEAVRVLVEAKVDVNSVGEVRSCGKASTGET